MKEPIRVLYWGMTNNIGGIESFIINVYRKIDKEKIQIDFLLDHNSPPIVFEDELREAGSKIYRVMYAEKESLIKARKSLDTFFNEHREFKAVHIHANAPFAFPLKYAKKYNIPIRIIHSHNSDTDERKIILPKRIFNSIRKKQVLRQIKKYPNIYFACSDNAAKYMFPNQDYTWIKNGIDLNSFRYDIKSRNDIRRELNVDDQCHVLGFIGRLRFQKNVFFI